MSTMLSVGTHMKHVQEITFKDLSVDKDILDALNEKGIVHPTEIQAGSIPPAIKGKDVIGRAVTGSGKTLAFSIPIVQELKKHTGRGIKAIILAPTRELAKQVEEEFMLAGKNTAIKTAVIYGGVDYEPQFKALEVADVVVGTPGRIIDHLQRGSLQLDAIEFFVLDEADRMLDMGFIDDIKRIIDKTPPHKQNFFFSATMPYEARVLAESFMQDPEVVKTEHVYVDNTKLEEFYVDCGSLYKTDMLTHLIKEENPELAIVFVNSRLFTDKIAEHLDRAGFKVKPLHGGHAQNKRENIVDQFDTGDIRILVATDVAARGLDIDGVTHVFNYDVPRDVQTYTHRVGRTARAGRSGKAFTLLDQEEHRLFSRIEGDSLRDIHKHHVDYSPKKIYLLPKREDRGPKRGGHKKGPRRGPRRHKK